MRKNGDKVVVVYPHDNNYMRFGQLVKKIKPAKDNIWEVLLDETAFFPEQKTTYNHFWLRLVESNEKICHS
jgi:hypothetical protein